MQIESLNDIWSMICEECKKTISESAVNCFLSQLKPVSLERGEFVLSVNNEWIRGLIEENYTEIIKTASANVLGLTLNVTIIFEDDEDKIIKAEQFSDGLSFEDFFSFSNFIVGSANRFAYAASLAVADNPNIIYNPLGIYGPSGVGKTELAKYLAKKKYLSQFLEYYSLLIQARPIFVECHLLQDLNFLIVNLYC